MRRVAKFISGIQIILVDQVFRDDGSQTLWLPVQLAFWRCVF